MIQKGFCFVEQLKEVKPGKTYPAYVKVEEKDGTLVEFHLNSFYVGMYCAVHVNGKFVAQQGDHDNKTFCVKLKKDISKAIDRGTTVEIDSICDCKLIP
jgi:hypothetical protein